MDESAIHLHDYDHDDVDDDDMDDEIEADDDELDSCHSPVVCAHAPPEPLIQPHHHDLMMPENSLITENRFTTSTTSQSSRVLSQPLASAH